MKNIWKILLAIGGFIAGLLVLSSKQDGSKKEFKKKVKDNKKKIDEVKSKTSKVQEEKKQTKAKIKKTSSSIKKNKG